MGRPANVNKHVPELGNAVEVNDAEVPVQVRLSIPRDLYDEYENLAMVQGLTVTELIMHRLRRCKDHNGLRSLYFSDFHVRALETLLQKKPLETPDQTIALLTASLSVKIGEFPPIPLSAQQVKRIGMSGYAGQTVEQRLAQIVQSAISKAVGI